MRRLKKIRSSALSKAFLFYVEQVASLELSLWILTIKQNLIKPALILTLLCVLHRFDSIQSCVQQLAEFRSRSGSLLRWLQSVQEQLPAKEPNLSTEGLQRRAQQLKVGLQFSLFTVFWHQFLFLVSWALINMSYKFACRICSQNGRPKEAKFRS